MDQTLAGLVVALPLAGAALLPMMAILSRRGTRWPALVLHLLTFAAAAAVFARTATTGEAIAHRMGGWPGPFGIELRLDGLSALIVLLVTGLSCFVASAPVDQGRGSARRASPVREGLVRGALSMLVAGLVGIAATRDVFNLFVFLEISSLAVYTLVASGGGRATVAAFRYLIAGTAAGSLYLLGVGFLYGLTGTLNMDDLAARLPGVEGGAALAVAVSLIAAGLAIKAALFPLHGWLPDAYVFAPAPAGGFIAAVMAKVSAYALLRLLGETLRGIPAGTMALETMVWLGALGVLVGGAMALAQRDIPRMLAWSSISAMGAILLAVGIGSPLALAGALFHVVAHALAKGCLFLGAGGLAEALGAGDRRTIRGLGRRTPWTAAALTVAAFSMIGLPPTAGFSSKLLLLQASLAEGGAAGVAAFGALMASSALAAMYFLRVLEGMWFRPPPAPESPPPALSRSLTAPVLALAALVLLGGVFSAVVEDGFVAGAVEAVTGPGPEAR